VTAAQERPASNPLGEGMGEYRAAAPAIMVIFGATGDLASRKLLPAIYNLARNRMLPVGFSLVGAAIDDLSQDDFSKRAAEAIRAHSRTQPVDENILRGFLQVMSYQPVDFAKLDGFKELKRQLDDIEQRMHTGGNAVFYCATPPPAYPLIVEQLKAAGLNRDAKGYRRIIVEKPFGMDLKSARELNRVL